MNTDTITSVLIVLFFIGFVPLNSAQGTGEETNLEFISALADSAATAASEAVDLSLGSVIFFDNMNLTEPLRNYFVQRFEHQFVKNGFQIQYSDSGSCDLYVKLYISNAAVTYPGILYTGIFREKQIQRMAELSYELKMVHILTQKVMYLKSEQLFRSGRFSASILPRIEQNSALLGVPGRPGQTLQGWTEFVITAALFSLIGYLLYAVRSR